MGAGNAHRKPNTNGMSNESMETLTNKLYATFPYCVEICCRFAYVAMSADRWAIVTNTWHYFDLFTS